MKGSHRLAGAVLILCAFLFYPLPGKAQTSLEIRLTLVSPGANGLASSVSQPQVHLATNHPGGSQGINGDGILVPIRASDLTANELRASQEAFRGQNVNLPFIPPVTSIDGGDKLSAVQPPVALVVIMVPVQVTSADNQPTIRYMLNDTGSQDYGQHPIVIPDPRQ